MTQNLCDKERKDRQTDREVYSCVYYMISVVKCSKLINQTSLSLFKCTHYVAI